jgi:hypothetical protein
MMMKLRVVRLRLFDVAAATASTIHFGRWLSETSAGAKGDKHVSCPDSFGKTHFPASTTAI